MARKKINDVEKLEKILERDKGENGKKKAYHKIESLLKYSLLSLVLIFGLVTVVAIVLKIRHKQTYVPPMLPEISSDYINGTHFEEKPVEIPDESSQPSHTLIGAGQDPSRRMDFDFSEVPSEIDAEDPATTFMSKPLLLEESPAVPSGRVVFSTSTLKPVIYDSDSAVVNDSSKFYSEKDASSRCEAQHRNDSSSIEVDPYIPSGLGGSSKVGIASEVNRPVLLSEDPAFPQVLEPSHDFVGF